MGGASTLVDDSLATRSFISPLEVEMRSGTLLLVASLLAVASAIGAPYLGKSGGSVDVEVAVEKVKHLTRTLNSGAKQIWHLDGPNKNSWTENGKKVDSSNYSFKAPGTIIIKKASKADEGLYDYEPAVAPPTPPPGVHVDPSLRGIQLTVL